MADTDPPTSDGDQSEQGSKRERDLIAKAFEGLSPQAGPDETTDPQGNAAPLPPAGTFPGYELIREIHRGGQGVVYLAIQLATQRRVAIKLMHGGPHVGSAGRARFEREVQILGQLDHPNIVGIHDSGATDDGSWFYVMDYISGTPLDQLIASPERPDIPETLRLFALICDAVGAAHLRGVIHRDLKPANIRINRQGEPIVVDFGLAKIAVPDVTDETTPHMMTATGQFIGSLPWASPEQAEGSPDKIDIRTDVYSLGVVLFQMLTGRFPYEVIGNMRDVLDNIMRAEPARPSTVRKQINDEVETIVLKCLSKERDRRYQSAIELARDIHLYLNGQPIEAKRDSGWYVVTKTLRRHKFVASVAVLFIVTITGFGIAMSVLYTQAQQAREAESIQATRAQSNLEDSRSFIHSLLGEFSDEIRNLRGATQARAIFAEQAQSHLERMEAQAGSDPAFLRDLADACDLVGDVRGGMFAPNLGASEDAHTMFQRAFDIRQGLRDENPERADAHIDLATSHLKLAIIDRQRGDYEIELTRREEGLALCDIAIPLLDPADDRVAQLAHDARALAIMGIADVSRRLALESTDAQATSDLRERARTLYTDTIAYWGDRASNAPSESVFARRHATCLSKISQLRIDRATTQRRAGGRLIASDPTEAAELLESARADLVAAAEAADAAITPLRSLALDHPASGQYPRDLMIVLDHAGKARMELATVLESIGQLPDAQPDMQATTTAYTQAAASLDEMLQIATELASADTSSVESQRDLAMAYNKVGDARQGLMQLGEASDAYTRSLEIRQTLVRTDRTRRHRSDLVVGLLKLADLTETIALEAREPRDQLMGLRAAERLYLDASDELDSMLADELISAGSRTILITRSALDDCRRNIAERTDGE